jgi:hypothetical protein
MLTRQQNPSDAAALAQCQGLSDEWRERLVAAARAAR